MKMRLTMVLALGALVLAAMLPSVATATEAEAKASCKQGGWQELVRSEDGSAFRNQGACVSYAARGGTPVVPDPLRAACEAAGGTLSDLSSGSSPYFTCSLPSLSESELAAFAELFAPVCFAYLDDELDARNLIISFGPKTVACAGFNVT